MNRPPACTYLKVPLDQYHLCVVMVFVRSFWPPSDGVCPVWSDGVCPCKTPTNHRFLWKTQADPEGPPRKPPTPALSGYRSRLCAPSSKRDVRPRGRPSQGILEPDSRRIPARQATALQPFREPDSAKYRDSQPHKERGIRGNQRRAKLNVVPSGRDRGHEIHADRKQPPHEEARCQREVRRSRPDQGRSHQQRPWTSAGQSERGRQHAQRHRRPEEQDRPEIH